MTKQAQEGTGVSGLQLWSITAAAAGVTGSASTTFVLSAASNFDQQVIQVGKLTGVQASPPNNGQSFGGTSIPVTVPATGFAIVGAYVAAGENITSWSGATQDFSTTTPNAAKLYMANAIATGTVSETGVAAGSVHFVYAAWGP